MFPCISAVFDSYKTCTDNTNDGCIMSTHYQIIEYIEACPGLRTDTGTDKQHDLQ